MFTTDASKNDFMTKFGKIWTILLKVNKSLKKSKSISGILGWVLTFFELPPPTYYFIGALNATKSLVTYFNVFYLSQNAKRASARKDTGLDQSLFSVQLFRLRINIIKVCKGANKGHLGGLDKVFKIRDHHHRIHRQILRPNEGLILILAQS